MATQSIRWEKVRLAPHEVGLLYDRAGNLTNDGQRAYFWDAENRLMRIEDLPGNISTLRRSDYTYDALSRRIRATRSAPAATIRARICRSSAASAPTIHWRSTPCMCG